MCFISDLLHSFFLFIELPTTLAVSNHNLPSWSTVVHICSSTAPWSTEGMIAIALYCNKQYCFCRFSKLVHLYPVLQHVCTLSFTYLYCYVERSKEVESSAIKNKKEASAVHCYLNGNWNVPISAITICKETKDGLKLYAPFMCCFFFWHKVSLSQCLALWCSHTNLCSLHSQSAVVSL